FMPALMLSGFLFDLRSMPVAVRAITYILPARYYVTLLQTIFLAGNIWGVILPNAAALAGMAAVLLALTNHVTRKKLASGAMFDAILRILALTRKDLLATLKDPRGQFSLLVPPIVQCLIFGYAATYDLTDIPYAALDQDRSAASYQLLAGLDGSGVLHRVANLTSQQEIRDYINKRRVLLVVQIDQDFHRRLMSGQPATVQVIADGRNSNTAGTAIAYLAAIV